MAEKEKKEKLSQSQLTKAWKRAHEVKDEVGRWEPEDGRYLVAVTSADRGESKSSGRDQVKWGLTFLEGDYKGKTYNSYDGLDTEEHLPYVMRFIEALGFEAPEEIDDLEGVLKKISKARPKIKIVIKTNGNYKNVNVDKLLSDEEGEEYEIPEEEESEGKGGKVKEDAEEEEKEEKKSKVSKEEGGKEEETEDEVDLEVGMKIMLLDKKGEEEIGVCTVKAIDADEGEVTVKDEDGEKYTVGVDRLRFIKEKPKASGGLKLKK